MVVVVVVGEFHFQLYCEDLDPATCSWVSSGYLVFVLLWIAELSAKTFRISTVQAFLTLMISPLTSHSVLQKVISSPSVMDG